MDAEKRFRITPQLVIGLLVVCLGVIFTLDNLGFLFAEDFFRFWPLALILIGAIKLFQSESPAGRLIGGVAIFLGFGFLLDNLDYMRFSIEDYWPLMLVVVGGGLIWQALHRRSERRDGTEDGHLDSRISVVAFLSGIERANNSPDFRGGELTALMGGCEIDLTNATISSGEAVLNTFAMWGGIELRVPEEWTVVLEAFPLMGGYSDKTHPPKGSLDRPQRLVIKGMALMGGVEIKN